MNSGQNTQAGGHEDSLSKRWARFNRALKHTEKKILVGWMRFAKKHRDSQKLPVFLFLLLFLDAFVLVIPSMLLCAAAVTISPRRWIFFGALFVAATVCNNSVAYYMGRILPAAELNMLFEFLHLDFAWQLAHEAILDYGKYATLIGGIASLPTQLIMALIGLANSQVEIGGTGVNIPFGVAIAFVALGHGIKIWTFCGLIRYGWVKLERRITAKTFEAYLTGGKR
jgi:membrane protein YqaA with SNARE-associated domain